MRNLKLFIIKNIIQKVHFFNYWYNRYKGRVVNTEKLYKELNFYFLNKTTSLQNFNRKYQADNLIVSFTSFPARIELVEYMIFSLLKQTIRPQKIILWLSEDEFKRSKKTIPKSLKKYIDFNFEIQFIKKNFRPYNKLIYSLIKYPDKIIVTADDDVFYKSDWLEGLCYTHNDFPNDIIACRVHSITFNGTHIAPYKEWSSSQNDISYLNFPTGVGGVLYPPGSLYKDVTNQELFLKLCPNADDIWFYVMALLNKKRIRKVKNTCSAVMHFDYIYNKKFSNIPQLMTINVDNNQNDVQLKAALEYYKIYDTFYKLYSD
ncbi:MAG: hypothetical protein LBE13_20065 [Bacteroidales bacterium]|jgi:hypothetical protein|nr:hypothetical protein [Bacteroidales bacterium]